ncbi:cucumisin [Vitis vinifera]|nr:cucumisin [Vitis vinifera]|eukprot:XP_010658508.2 PREDICTED: cucumisin [Vitis vinifera]
MYRCPSTTKRIAYHHLMARQKNSSLWFLLLSLICSLLSTHSTAAASEDDVRKEYIVYMGAKPAGDFSASAIHTNMLEQVFGSGRASSSLVRSYKRSFNGFVAKLTEDEMQQMKGMDGVVSVFPSEKKQLHTTRSWDFVGFPRQVKRTSFESDIIIGVLDGGIWPESDSFDDKGFGPPPRKWKGTCQGFSNFTCNNKIIGAKYYKSDRKFSPEDLQSPRDSDGHGTHTASTAAGGLVNMASLMGFGLGTARGGVPSARIAVYKICWSDGCDDADILAAFDDAIADGVDIISYSLGNPPSRDYFKDTAAIGAFHAMKNGILTSTSAGNDGPRLVSVVNVAPWSLSVAASTIDRKFLTEVQLGDKKVYKGFSINAFEPNGMYPLIYGGDAPNTRGGFRGNTSRFCEINSLNPNLVKGKIVLCIGLGAGFKEAWSAFLAGAVGTVIVDGLRLPKDSSNIYPLPASRLSAGDGKRIAYYISSTSNPTASILKSIEVKDTLAPYVPSFSSRGPNNITHDLLKPDLTAPGVHILAAWSPISPISQMSGDNRVAQYNILSGTSMACPHATGAAAYIKSFHPTWSPAAIKSALMTTATPMSARKNPEAEFAYGAGNIDPVRAVHPGLVYDADEIDFVNFLCGEGYSIQTLRKVTGDHSVCSKATNGAVWDLNYPSFALSIPYKESIARTFKRSVTNVGLPVSTYKATVIGAPKGLKINVKPNILSFTSIGQKLSFVLKVEGRIVKDMVSASLVWDDGLHKVRSPIIVYAVQ